MTDQYGAHRPLRLGMVGGGQGGFIGEVHRMAARLDGAWDLVAGALSSNPERSIASARDLGLDPERSYTDFGRMAQVEAMRADCIDAVAIVTPNHLHAEAAIAFLNAGIHVICDKPIAATLEQANAIEKAVRQSGCHFFLTHTYTGYPMVREARDIVRRGDLGEIRMVNVEYAQDWLAMELEASGQKQAEWRTDPAKSGAGGAVADIGTHAINLVEFVTGLELESLACDLTAFVPGRRLDDNVSALLRFASGARGILWASQIAVGKSNALRLRVYGDRGGLEWDQEAPDRLSVTPLNEPTRIHARGGTELSQSATACSRLPAGHPEGFVEAFANIYRDAARVIWKPNTSTTLPGIVDGQAGMRFIAACVESSNGNAAWVRV